MSERRNRASKWWFWGPVIAANVYMLGMWALSWTGALERLSMLGPPGDFLYDVFVAPALAFAMLVTAWSLSDAYGGHLLAALALWELMALALGFFLYRAVALFSARAAGETARCHWSWWGLVAWVGVWAPALVAGVSLVYLAGKHYHRGVSFSKGLHPFEWMYDLCIFARVVLLVLAGSWGVFFISAKAIRQWGQKLSMLLCIAIATGVLLLVILVPEAWILEVFFRFGAVALLLLVASCAVVLLSVKTTVDKEKKRSLLFSSVMALVLLLLMMPVMGLSHSTGRRSGYRRLDTEALVKECRTLTSLLGEDKSLRIDYYYPLLIEQAPAPPPSPPYIASLGPVFVHIQENAVVLQMDGGGPAAHEGVFVLLEPVDTNPADYAREHGISVLDTERLVFTYVLYDYRTLPLEAD